MIFPELPKRNPWLTHCMHNTLETVHIQKTPLRGNENTKELSKKDIEAWWIKHGLATDPAAIPTHRSRNEPIDYWAKDAVEFYALCTGIVCWIVYWFGVHHGVW